MRAILDDFSSLGRAFRRSGSLQGEIDKLRTMHDIASRHGYKVVIRAETARVRQAFQQLVDEAGLSSSITVR
jgi:hypothetical protein